jgi:hypothetical protein
MATNAPVTEPFSAGYELVHNAEVFTHEGEAIMDREMAQALAERFPLPLIGQVGGLHYQFELCSSIPGMSLAVPERNHDDPDVLLIQR